MLIKKNNNDFRSKYLEVTVYKNLQFFSKFYKKTITAAPLSEPHGPPGSADHSLGNTGLQYAGPVWWGYAMAADKTRIDRSLRRLLRADFITSYSSQTPTWSLITTAVTKLLEAAIANEYHVLRPLFQPLLHHSRNLRLRFHNFALLLYKGQQKLYRWVSI